MVKWILNAMVFPLFLIIISIILFNSTGQKIFSILSVFIFMFCFIKAELKENKYKREIERLTERIERLERKGE